MSELVPLGRTRGAYGFRGWVRVQPYETGDVLLKARRWFLKTMTGESIRLSITGIRRHGDGFVVKWTGCETKEEADRLKGEVSVLREDFPSAGQDEVWAVDVIGSRVVNQAGVRLGVIEDIGSNGVQDLFVIRWTTPEGKKAHFMIPNVKDVYILSIDTAQKCVTVDWDADWR